MKSPYTGKEMELKIEPRELEFRKERFNIQSHTYICADTGEQFETQQQAELNYNQVINGYRAKHHIPFPEEITATREKYGLSARQMSQILGFGINQYSKYEQGEVPSISNGISISLASNPHAFEVLVKQCADLKDTVRNKIRVKLNDEKQKAPDPIEFILPFHNPDIFNGFRRFDLSRFINIVNLFSAKVKPYKVKMNKLLYYVDFACFKYYGRSMTGLRYEAIQMGPVPAHYAMLFDFSKGSGAFETEEIWFEETGTSGEKFSADIRFFKKELFLEAELEILKRVIQRFQDTTTNEIIKLSHNELGWMENAPGRKVIPYTSAFSLNQL
jgi:putative zinc finger/helix-turn-helix YgiT family protein